MTKKNFPLSDVYGLLEPGPVVLLTTQRKDKPNVMTHSWLTMLEFEPPLVGCVISNRNYSFAALESSGECVINIPTSHLQAAVVGCGNTSGRRTNKFAKFGLTPMPAKYVQAPLIKECFANLECKLVDADMVPRYNLFVFEVLKAWIDPKMDHAPTMHHRGSGAFMLAGETITLQSKMK
ncbi:flavin reductase family protein [Uliginosibacterium flavum]|uniref:Flavin reductase family protein n=1 Tax=Uliginosibacterium flavum TaxID=1396831 RepID=A0ABV2TNI5_9RHOO